MASLSTMQTNVAAELGLVNTATGDQPQITNALNRAVIDMLKKTHVFVAPGTLNDTGGDGDYTLDPAILAIEEIYVSSSGIGGYTLDRVDTAELIAMRAPGTSSEASPRFYAVMGSNLLLIHPVPVSADTLTAYYVPVPAPLTNPTDDPSVVTFGGIPAEFHEGLELRAMWKLGSLTDDQSSAQGSRYKQDYQDFIAEMKADIRTKGGKRLARMLPPGHRRLGRRLLNPGQRYA